MNQIMVAFITGLTTGGLSCLAVQGGLLAGSLEQQVEKDLLENRKNPKYGSIKESNKNRKNLRVNNGIKPNLALPIAQFLAAKIVAYSILGLLLGAIGQVFQLNTTMRAVLLIAVGVFMVGNALRIFNVHPFFRIFLIEPPKFITRYIRKTAKKDTDLFSPLFLGALTVLIPCGVTQAMMAVAIATGNPIQGAAIMLAFTLGTSPVFFLVSYLTMKLGSKLENFFMRFVAIILLLLGMITIDSGLNLAGSPLSLSYIIQNSANSNSSEQVVLAGNDLILNVTNQGYSPRRLQASSDTPIKLNLVTKNVYSCSRDFVIPALGLQVLLPDTGNVPIEIPAQKPGTILRFTCSMGMYTGDIIFSQN